MSVVLRDYTTIIAVVRLIVCTPLRKNVGTVRHINAGSWGGKNIAEVSWSEVRKKEMNFYEKKWTAS